ncbi:Putative uncharacterized protein [Desulfurococcus amylolyticus 1221n]|uniref:DUF58 domain-containing protein n=1 Tax=Desulfurococcus amylolyticus (strain DSM 18924 / JCM 16383 / VKM B-2413 / 1221n) TaxID=490899 RepID=B8D3U0_DESA1|nr:DUF58 domain-containing protein [Desulfurococcus amylolyticus]ACL10771.1 Putative uncharacterized protein [Desulfurococcus amylolyticus 1221n]
MKITSTGIVYLVLTTLSLIYSIASTNPFYYLLSLLAVSIFISEYYLFRDVSSVINEVKVSRRIPGRSILELETVEIGVELSNDTGRSIPRVLVIEDFPRYIQPEVKPVFTVFLPAYSKSILSYRVKALAPGRIDLPGLRLVFTDPLSFFYDTLSIELRNYIVAQPLYTRIDEALKSIERITGINTRGHAFGGEYDLANIREYFPGDDVRRILWKHYAKTGNLMVREDYGDVRPSILLVIDIRKRLWEIGSGVNTLAHVQLRLARSLLESLSTVMAHVDVAMCTEQSPKIYFDAWRDPSEAFYSLISTLQPGGGCEVPLSTIKQVLAYTSGRRYDSVIIVTNPVTLVEDGVDPVKEMASLAPGRTIVVLPRFDYDVYAGLRGKELAAVVGELVGETGVEAFIVEEDLRVVV